VVAGQAAISRAGTSTLIIQTTERATINWQSFNIDVSDAVRFAQPSISSIALNRVLDQNPTKIFGSLSANGQIFILNPNGVLFGGSAQVDVGGLVAATLSLSTSDFMTGRYRLTSDGLVPGTPVGNVINLGTILANGGYVALIGPSVRNEGAIVANNGRVVLAGADTVSVSMNGNKLVGLTVERGTLNALAENKGLIKADGGHVILTAKAADELVKSVVNNDGVIEAQTLTNVGGTIQLLAPGGAVNVGGRLDASAGSTESNGGFIETSGNTVNIADSARITTQSAQRATGTWLIDPVDFTIAAGAGAQTASGIGSTTLSTALGTSNVAIATAAGAGNGDIFINGTVTWATPNRLSLSAAHNIDFTGGGVLSASSAASSVILNAGNAGTSLTGAILAHTSNTVVTAGSLAAKASSGIAGNATRLRTSVAALALENTVSGGIYATNSNNVTVAAASTNGDIDIRTANRMNVLALEPPAAGGSITVGTVNGVTGITTTDGSSAKGSITLTAGNGASPSLFGRIVGSGGAGGSITLNAALSAVQTATLTAGNGSNGGGFFGHGGAGGSIALNAALGTGQAATLTAGNGGSGGTTHANGGAGGSITLSAALSSAQAATLIAGNGGFGGSSGGVSSGGFLGGGFGGSGGSITLNAALSATQPVMLRAGNGGGGGFGGTFGGMDVGAGGGGGRGGSITLNAALSTDQAVTLIAGNGGTGGRGGVVSGFVVPLVGIVVDLVGRDGSGGAGGSITLNAEGVTAAGSGDAIQLAGRNFVNNAGATALIASNGRWLVWSTNPANDTRGGLVYDFKQYNANFGATAPAQASGNGFLYALAPTITPSLVGTVVKTYDGSDTARLLAGNYAVNAIDGDTVTLNNPSTGNYDSSNAGVGKVVTVSGIAIVSTTNGAATVYGYALGATTAIANIGTINQRGLTVVANNATKLYGDPDPALTFNVGGTFAGADTITSVITGALVRVAGESVAASPYSINQGTLATNANYSISTYTPGQFTITPRVLSVIADDKSNFRGNALPSFTATYEGFALADAPSSLAGTLAFATLATTLSPPGSYAITPYGQSATNYAIRYVDGVLSITNPPLPPAGVQGAIDTAQAGRVDMRGASSNRVNNLITVSGSGVSLPAGVE
jgi:filamentous hemagglutinin family protein